MLLTKYTALIYCEIVNCNNYYCSYRVISIRNNYKVYLILLRALLTHFITLLNEI